MVGRGVTLREVFCTSAALSLPSLTHSAGFWAAPVSAVADFVVAVYPAGFLGEHLFCFCVFQHTHFSMKKIRSVLESYVLAPTVPLCVAIISLLTNLLVKVNYIPCWMDSWCEVWKTQVSKELNRCWEGKKWLRLKVGQWRKASEVLEYQVMQYDSRLCACCS